MHFAFVLGQQFEKYALCTKSMSIIMTQGIQSWPNLPTLVLGLWAQLAAPLQMLIMYLISFAFLNLVEHQTTKHQSQIFFKAHSVFCASKGRLYVDTTLCT